RHPARPAGTRIRAVRTAGRVAVECHRGYRARPHPRPHDCARTRWRRDAREPRPAWPSGDAAPSGGPSGGESLAAQDTAFDLVEFDRFEQRPEIALAEAFVALPLDDLEENRPDGVLCEDLQEQALFRRPVDQDLVGLKPLHILAVFRQPLV